VHEFRRETRCEVPRFEIAPASRLEPPRGPPSA
jgi:hypothetical protein